MYLTKTDIAITCRLRLIQLIQLMKNSGTVKTQVMTKAVHPEGTHILFPLLQKSIIDNISFSYTYDFLVS